MAPSLNLRLTDELHAELKAAAQESRRSLNSEIVLRLEESLGALTERGVVRGPGTSAAELLEAAPRSVSAPSESLGTREGLTDPVSGSSRAPSDCSRARFHRSGVFCKECDYSG